jgi:hypothetical protein
MQKRNTMLRGALEHEMYRREHTPKACCDACGKRAELTFSVSCGIDTWACEECRGVQYARRGVDLAKQYNDEMLRRQDVWDKAREDARTIEDESDERRTD